MRDTLKTIKLYGHLGEQFGRVHRLAVASPAEAIRALTSQFAGFRDAVERGGMRYQVRIGGVASDDPKRDLSICTGQSIAFVPELTAAKSGFGQFLVGAALIVLAWWNPMGWAAAAGTLGGAGISAMYSVGISMAIGGVAQMLSPTPSAPKTQDAQENRPSYIYNGAFNTAQQGQAIPVVFGRMRVGSIVVGVGSYAERIPA